MEKNLGKNVLTDFPYRKSYYITHPWVFIRDCWDNLRGAWYRITRGIAPVDLWNFDTHLENLIPYGLRWLAEHSHGWPQSEEFPEYEDWENYLRKLADEWEYAFQENVGDKNENEYYDEFHALWKENGISYKDKDGFICHRIEENPETLEIRTKYFAREEEIAQQHMSLQHECFTKLEHIWGSLWD